MALILDGTTGIVANNIAANTITSTQIASGSRMVFGNMPAGSILQVVSARGSGSDVLYSNGATPTVVSATITPLSSSSKIAIFGSAYVSGNGGSNSWMGGWIIRNGSNIAEMGYVGTGGAGNAGIVGTNYLDSPATTSAVTYGLVLTTGSGGTTSWYTSPLKTNIMLMEIAV